MWSFSVGLYLVYFEDGSLLLAAVYGFTSCGSILLLGGLLGNWVDNNPRLRGKGNVAYYFSLLPIHFVKMGVLELPFVTQSVSLSHFVSVIASTIFSLAYQT